MRGMPGGMQLEVSLRAMPLFARVFLLPGLGIGKVVALELRGLGRRRARYGSSTAQYPYATPVREAVQGRIATPWAMPPRIISAGCAWAAGMVVAATQQAMPATTEYNQLSHVSPNPAAPSCGPMRIIQ